MRFLFKHIEWLFIRGQVSATAEQMIRANGERAFVCALERAWEAACERRDAYAWFWQAVAREIERRGSC